MSLDNEAGFGNQATHELDSKVFDRQLEIQRVNFITSTSDSKVFDRQLENYKNI